MKYHFEEDKYKIFQNNKLDIFEKIFMPLYLFITICLFYQLPIYNQKYLFWYIFCSQFAIYFFQKNLRNRLLFGFTIFISFVHFLISFEIHNNLAYSLRLTFFLLFLVQTLRYFSLKIQKSEISIPGLYSNYEGASFFEYILVFAYIGIIAGSILFFYQF